MTKFDSKSRAGAALMRHSMDGTSAVNLLSEKLFYPNDISLDVATKKIYFLDHYFDFIQQCDYDGSSRKFLQRLPLMKFHRVTFFENMFYGAVNKNLSVIQVSKSSSIFKKVLAENLEANPKMVKIFHQQTQPMRGKVCANSKCEHLCVPIMEDTRIVEKCLCREGFTLENGKCKIRDAKKFLIFVQDNPNMLKAVDVDGSDEHIFAPIVGLKSNIAFDVDLNGKVVYFTSYSDLNSSETNIIEFQSFNGSDRGMLKGSFGAIQSMSYDWVGKNLYYSSQSPKAKIAVVRVKQDSDDPLVIKTLISKNIIGPSSIALDPENGEFLKSLQRKKKLSKNSQIVSKFPLKYCLCSNFSTNQTST
jgi:low density lipoprotein-related protein 2